MHSHTPRTQSPCPPQSPSERQPPGKHGVAKARGPEPSSLGSVAALSSDPVAFSVALPWLVAPQPSSPPAEGGAGFSMRSHCASVYAARCRELGLGRGLRLGRGPGLGLRLGFGLGLGLGLAPNPKPNLQRDRDLDEVRKAGD